MPKKSNSVAPGTMGVSRLFLKKFFEKGVTENDLYYLSTPNGKRTLDEIVDLVVEMRLEYEASRFFFHVDYEKDPLSLIADGNYALVSNLTCLDRIPIRKLGNGEKEILLFIIKKDMCTHEVIGEMVSCGFHTAGFMELLHFRLNVPDDEIDKIVAINPINSFGVQYCSVIYKYNARIFLDLSHFYYESKWPKGTKFLVHRQNLFAIS